MRRTVKITIPGKRSEQPGERDNGKTFLITEMSADQGERFCTQVLYLVSHGETPDGAAAALAMKGVDFSDIRIAKALQDPSVDRDLWECVRYQHATNQKPLPIEHGENSVIEEIATRMLLRMEVFKVHLGFSRTAEPSSSESLPTSTG